VGQEVIDLKSIRKDLPNSMIDLVTDHAEFLQSLETLKLDNLKERIPLSEVHLSSPITKCDKLVCVGMNYKDHCEEQNVPVPVEPIFFSKFPSNLVGPNDPIKYPALTEQLDYEVELAFVIGKKGKNIPVESAMDHVFGYAVAHDVSARDWQFNKNGGQWLLGKAMDDFCPLGPEIVTKAELRDPHGLRIRCVVNGVTRQDSNTAQMVHRVDAIIAFLSKVLTLLPGDVIITGTPPGVGVFQKPPFFLKRGDVVECEIEHIGKLRNEII
jgi:2-keto-4-pentenoate hydratase/2-oxohepta-3-ene-1,7-dioic acid hydratase in catechol pathway